MSETLGKAELKLKRFPFWRTSESFGIFRYVMVISIMGLPIGRDFQTLHGH